MHYQTRVSELAGTGKTLDHHRALREEESGGTVLFQGETAEILLGEVGEETAPPARGTCLRLSVVILYGESLCNRAGEDRKENREGDKADKPTKEGPTSEQQRPYPIWTGEFCGKIASYERDRRKPQESDDINAGAFADTTGL